MGKTIDECSPEEALNYLKSYLATVDTVSEAQAYYDSEASTASSASERSRFRAMSLEAERDLELLVNRRRAFLNGKSSIRPPTGAEVAQAKERARKMAEIIAQNKKAEAVIALSTEALNAFAGFTETEKA